MQERINGRNLYYTFLAGARKIIDNQAEINRLNVFPVADADTGTNMASTIRTIVDSLKPDRSFKVTADAIGIAALSGARGNSGIIFAQFLYGFSEEVSDCEEITIKDFADSLMRSIRYLYEAVSHPVEGTILTVIREWVEYIHKHHERFDSFPKLIADSYEAAKLSLSETTQKLKVLARANVVDAGAKGFVVFLEGMLELIKNRDIKAVIELANTLQTVGVTEEVPMEMPLYRYCTEAMIEGDTLERTQLMKMLESYGDSVVVAGSRKKHRVHVHTNNPADMFAELSENAKILSQKVEDMVRQYEAAHARKYRIALVTDSTCDLPAEIIKNYQINPVPINLVVGGNHYLDGVTLMSEDFYRLAARTSEFPSTAQPAPATFINLYSQLATQYDSVIAIHISGNLSGTYGTSLSAARQVEKESGKRITVIDSLNISGGVGLQVKRAAEMIAEGRSHQEIVDSVMKQRGQTGIFVSVRTLEYFIRSGRISPVKGFIAKLLKVKPVITVNPDGKAALIEKPLSYEANRRKVMEKVSGRLKGHNLYGYSVTHVDSPGDAEFFIGSMRSLTGREPDFVSNVTPSLGLHTGKGTVAVTIMTE